jgi:hypothetical protein
MTNVLEIVTIPIVPYLLDRMINVAYVVWITVCKILSDGIIVCPCSLALLAQL